MLFQPPPHARDAMLCVTTQRHSAHTFPRGKPAGFFPLTEIATSIYSHGWTGRALRNNQSLKYITWNPQRWSSTCFGSTSISWLQAARNQTPEKSDFKIARKSILRIFFPSTLFPAHFNCTSTFWIHHFEISGTSHHFSVTPAAPLWTLANHLCSVTSLKEKPQGLPSKYISPKTPLCQKHFTHGFIKGDSNSALIGLHQRNRTK